MERGIQGDGLRIEERGRQTSPHRCRTETCNMIIGRFGGNKPYVVSFVSCLFLFVFFFLACTCNRACTEVKCVSRICDFEDPRISCRIADRNWDGTLGLATDRFRRNPAGVRGLACFSPFLCRSN